MNGPSVAVVRGAASAVGGAAVFVALRFWKGLVATVLVMAVLALVYVYNLEYRSSLEEAVQGAAVAGK